MPLKVLGLSRVEATYLWTQILKPPYWHNQSCWVISIVYLQRISIFYKNYYPPNFLYNVYVTIESTFNVFTKFHFTETDSLVLYYFQLKECMEEDLIFIDFKEGEITFPPTYKFDPGTDKYDTRYGWSSSYLIL